MVRVPQRVDPETLQRVRTNFLADFTVNFASESACLVPVEHPENKPEKTKCNAWAMTTAGEGLFPWRILWQILRRIFRRIFWQIFLADFSADLLADLLADSPWRFSRGFLLGIADGIFLKTFLNPAKQRT